jgi:hypothetical protein
MTALMTMEQAGNGSISVCMANYSRRWCIRAVLGISQLTSHIESTFAR